MSEAILTVDLSYGDTGKGTTVDFLARKTNAKLVVRHNGGAQAAHNVVTPDGRHHTFAQFGSGTFVNVPTFLSRFMLVDPLALLNEGNHLEELGIKNPYQMVYVDEDAPVVTPFHRAANRLREMGRGEGRHGSTGMGIGETVIDVIAFPDTYLRMGDLKDEKVLLKKLKEIKQRKLDSLSQELSLLRNEEFALKEILTLTHPSTFELCLWAFPYVANKVRVVDQSLLGEVLEGNGHVIFEASQGVLLDELHGFSPYTTWSNTTLGNARTLLKELGFSGKTTSLGILRSYSSRHGPGPFVPEDESLKDALPELHNEFGRWQGAFRVGPFDAVASRYAKNVVRFLDGLVITHMDKLDVLSGHPICTAYVSPYGGRMTDLPVYPFGDLNLFLYKPEFEFSPNGSSSTSEEFIERIEESLNLPVVITSSGVTANEKQILTSGNFPPVCIGE